MPDWRMVPGYEYVTVDDFLHFRRVASGRVDRDRAIRLCEHAERIRRNLDRMGARVDLAYHPRSPGEGRKPDSDLSERKAMILDAMQSLGPQWSSAKEIAAKLGLPIQPVISALIIMRNDGLILATKLPGRKDGARWRSAQ